MCPSMRFDGNCPTCGRHLHIPVELYGKRVRCHGCNAEFRATAQREPLPSPLPSDISTGPISTGPISTGSTTVWNIPLDVRVDALLAAADRQIDQAGLANSPATQAQL